MTKGTRIDTYAIVLRVNWLEQLLLNVSEL